METKNFSFCYYCNNKQYNLCIDLKEIGSTINGGFAEYIEIPKQTLDIGALIPIPDSLNNDEATLLEPLSCCLNGFSHIATAPVSIREETKEENTTMVIIGDGPIGLLHLQLSKLFGIKAVIVVGKVLARIQKAKSMGVYEVVYVSDNGVDDDSSYKKKILELTDGIGANLVVVATSNPTALDLAMKVASKNSKINIFTGMPKGAAISLDPN
jgi:L-iditol 2-dehydrogenase